MTKRYRAFGNSERGESRTQIVNDGENPFPEDEITNGVSHVFIKVFSYGDDPRDPFVEVIATTVERAIDVWQRVVTSIDPPRWFE